MILTRQCRVVVLVLLAVHCRWPQSWAASLYAQITYPTPGRSLTTLMLSCFNKFAEPTPERSRI